VKDVGGGEREREREREKLDHYLNPIIFNSGIRGLVTRAARD